MGGVERKIMVKYPDQRNNIIDAIRGLSDKEYQKRVWLDRDAIDSFSFVIDILYDIIGLRDFKSELWSGVVTKDENETVFVDAVMKVLDDILDKYGANRSNEYYINLPEWPRVVASAKRYINYVDKER